MGVPASRSSAQLGALLSDHPQSVVGSRGRMIQSYVALGIGAALMGAGLIAFVALASAAGQQALICLGFGGFCVLGIGALGYFDARSTRDMALRVYERGIRYIDRSGQKVWAWEDIAAIYHHQVVHQDTRTVRHVYQLVHHSGDTFSFYDHVRDPATAIAIIRQHTYALLLPRLTAAIAAGRPVAFGAVTLAPDGLQVKGSLIPWAEVARVVLSGNTLMIERPGGGWFNDLEVNAGAVANVELLQQLVAGRLGSARP